jgi:hypothetical protein
MELQIEVDSSSDRDTERTVPTRPVTLWMENARTPMTRGVVANISRGGACVWSRGAFEVGDEVAVHLRFDRGLPIPATAKVVWSGYTVKGTPRFGVTWTHDGDDRGRLEALISGC